GDAIFRDHVFRQRSPTLSASEATRERAMSEQLMDTEEAKRQGYHVTPGGRQWSSAPRQPVDKSRWKPCQACSRLIPVVAGTCSYVCPFCGQGRVGTPDDSPDSLAQTACHECGAELGDSFQCRKCSFPRGWMTVQCPYCGARQAVHAPHWVAHCDLFTLECVKCESRFDSLCIC